MSKNYKLPAITWLKMTDYMHGWLQSELGGALRIKDQKVVCTFHLPGAKEILKMETEEDLMDAGKTGNSMSDTRRCCAEAGLKLHPDTVEQLYGLTKESLKLYVPLECPKACLTKNGVLRPWTLDVNFGKLQAKAMQRFLREEFWKGVEEFNADYAKRMGGKRYPAVEMIEAFCAETGTPEIHVEAMRREWQRRCKRKASASASSCVPSVASDQGSSA